MQAIQTHRRTFHLLLLAVLALMQAIQPCLAAESRTPSGDDFDDGANVWSQPSSDIEPRQVRFGTVGQVELSSGTRGLALNCGRFDIASPIQIFARLLADKPGTWHGLVPIFVDASGDDDDDDFHILPTNAEPAPQNGTAGGDDEDDGLNLLP